MEEKIWKAALAGLLHDVGKLEQRARTDPWLPAPGHEQEGQPVHATWTGYFIEQYVAAPYRAPALHGAYHHAPEKSPAQDHSLSLLVELADKLSAGERADPLEKGKPKDPPQQMVTIFDRLQFKGTPAKAEHYLDLQPLSLDEKALFPTTKKDRQVRGSAYLALCEQLRAAAGQVVDDPAVYLEHLLFAMQRSAWCVPSAYYHSVPDVSLYDHSRMTAALSVCLAEHADQVPAWLKAVEADYSGKAGSASAELLNTDAALLVGGDISGIQDFIYTISSKNAAKTLRGRSFYLQLLTEAVLRFVLKALGLPYTNVIYAGGGHFYLLAPLSAGAKLDEVRKSVSDRLIHHHGVSLYLAIGSARVPLSGFRIGRFPAYWSEMHASLAQAKNHRYQELGDELFDHVFAVPAQGGNPDAACAVCGEDVRPVSKLDDDDPEEADSPENRLKICSLCQSFDQQLGSLLPETHFIALGFGSATMARPGTARDTLAAFGMMFQLLPDASAAINLPGAESVTIWALNDPRSGKWPVSGLPQANTLHYTVNRIPRLTFDELREKVRGGFEYLGVLRMDVDDMGELFNKGFGDPTLGSTATIARLSTLSFQVSLFFEGWVKRLCEDVSGDIYAVYAGGDDLFLIGPWDVIPDLARRIYKDFKAYTGAHPGLHISGGMAFIGGKYPVYQAARDAASAEHTAKQMNGKDAFAFLDEAHHWTDFEELDLMKERILRLVGGSGEQAQDKAGLGGPKGIIGNLRVLADRQAQSGRSLGRPQWGPWMWLGAYQLARMAEQNKDKNPALSAELLAIRDSLEKDRYQKIHYWGIAARWAQLLTRNKPEKRKEPTNG